MKTWLKNCGKTLSKHYMGILMVAVIISSYAAFFAAISDAAFWKVIATTPEPECCAVCEERNGNRYHAPVLVNLSTGTMRKLEIYDSDPRRLGEVAEEQRWDDWVFTFIDGNATMSWSSEDQTNIAYIGEKVGKFAPALFCHDCRALLADTATEGYALLDVYDLENIQAYAVENGAEYTIRDYTVSIYKDKENGGLTAFSLIMDEIGHEHFGPHGEIVHQELLRRSCIEISYQKNCRCETGHLSLYHNGSIIF